MFVRADHIYIDSRFVSFLDVDECDNGISQCHSSALCKNNAPGYCCECTDGYYGNGVDCVKEGKIIVCPKTEKCRP